MKSRLNLLIAMLLCMARAASAEPPAYEADLSALLSKLQSMGHGYYSDQEWQAVLSQVDGMAERAARSGDWNNVVEAKVIKAMVLSDMRGQHVEALQILRETKDEYAGRNAPALKKVYVRTAEIQGKLGDEDAVRTTIEEFKKSPFYDPEAYAYGGGQGRDVPLALVRPTATGNDSISVTAMNVAKRRAGYVAGALFPDFTMTARDGNVLMSGELRGKVLLVDFWNRNWTPWRRDLPQLVSLYQRYQAAGFEILGVSLERHAENLDAFLSDSKITWPIADDDQQLTKALGIFGECTNFLLDQNGVIIGRDLRSADLAQAVKRALGP